MIKKYDQYHDKINEGIGFSPININITYDTTEPYGVKSEKLLERIANMVEQSLSNQGWNGRIDIHFNDKTKTVK